MTNSTAVVDLFLYFLHNVNNILPSTRQTQNLTHLAYFEFSHILSYKWESGLQTFSLMGLKNFRNCEVLFEWWHSPHLFPFPNEHILSLVSLIIVCFSYVVFCNIVVKVWWCEQCKGFEDTFHILGVAPAAKRLLMLMLPAFTIRPVSI